MQFMLFMIPKDYHTASSAVMPDPGAIEAMTTFNVLLQSAGVLRSVNGLTPPASGVRIASDGRHPTARHGPFVDTTETVGGYWILELTSQQEAIDWAMRCPASAGDTIEVRQIQGD